MSEIKTYVCPNCGANTTNTQNCEYCGSLLVRFVEKGIDLSHTSYTNNNAVFPGLIEELKRNIKLQEENPYNPVATDLYKQIEDNTASDYIGIFTGVLWDDGTFSPEFDNPDEIQLCIAVDFNTYSDVDIKELKEYNDIMDAQLAKFRQLDSFPLFTPHNGAYTDHDGFARYGRQYAINFGKDAEGAARLISEILIKVKGWLPTEPFDIFTNVGDDINRAREDWLIAHGFSSAQPQQSMDDNSGCMVLIGAFIVTLGSILCGCFA